MRNINFISVQSSSLSLLGGVFDISTLATNAFVQTSEKRTISTAMAALSGLSTTSFTSTTDAAIGDYIVVTDGSTTNTQKIATKSGAGTFTYTVAVAFAGTITGANLTAVAGVGDSVYVIQDIIAGEDMTFKDHGSSPSVPLLDADGAVRFNSYQQRYIYPLTGQLSPNPLTYHAFWVVRKYKETYDSMFSDGASDLKIRDNESPGRFLEGWENGTVETHWQDGSGLTIVELIGDDAGTGLATIKVDGIEYASLTMPSGQGFRSLHFGDGDSPHSAQMDYAALILNRDRILTNNEAEQVRVYLREMYSIADLDPAVIVNNAISGIGTNNSAYSATEAYTDTGATTLATTDKAVIESFKGLGNGSLVNLPRTSVDLEPDTWFQNIGNGYNVSSLFRKLSRTDQFIDIHNSDIDMQWGANASGGDVDFECIYIARSWWGIAFQESLLSVGDIGFKQLLDSFQIIDGGYNYTTNPLDGSITPGQEFVVSFKKVASTKVWTLEVNGVEIDTQTSTGAAIVNYFKIGTNSHPIEHHFRLMNIRVGGFFTAAEKTRILALSNAVYPRGVLPTFPYLDDAYSTTNFWDNPTNTWTLNIGTFSGGSGVAGTHEYQWYYSNADIRTAAGVVGSLLDYHLPIVGATSQNLTRDDYTGVGQPFNGHEGDGFNRVFRVTTPVDSNGVKGLPIPSKDYLDNIP